MPPSDSPQEPAADTQPSASPQPADSTTSTSPPPANPTPSEPAPTTTTATTTTTPDPAQSRLEKWKALKARANTATQTNLKEVYAERRRAALDPQTTSKLHRKKTEAEFKLARAEALEAGEDFERKRAWDWTIEESERWDRRMEKKKRHVEDVAFQDFSQSARKMYKKAIRELKPDREGYEEEKRKLIKSGHVVETEDGELVVVDTDGRFYADANSMEFIENRPKKENVDRLVAELKKEEDRRMRRRGGKGEEEDVTYINDKNKQFNQKLQRAYGKYTKEIRDSFERGTMI